MGSRSRGKNPTLFFEGFPKQNVSFVAVSLMDIFVIWMSKVNIFDRTDYVTYMYKFVFTFVFLYNLAVILLWLWF